MLYSVPEFYSSPNDNQSHGYVCFIPTEQYSEFIERLVYLIESIKSYSKNLKPNIAGVANCNGEDITTSFKGADKYLKNIGFKKKNESMINLARYYPPANKADKTIDWLYFIFIKNYQCWRDYWTIYLVYDSAFIDSLTKPIFDSFNKFCLGASYYYCMFGNITKKADPTSMLPGLFRAQDHYDFSFNFSMHVVGSRLSDHMRWEQYGVYKEDNPYLYFLLEEQCFSEKKLEAISKELDLEKWISQKGYRGQISHTDEGMVCWHIEPANVQGVMEELSKFEIVLPYITIHSPLRYFDWQAYHR